MASPFMGGPSPFSRWGSRLAGFVFLADPRVPTAIVAQGDKIALMTPVFTPYLEIPELERFSSSLETDFELYPFDIAGSIAHARGLAAAGVISKAKLTSIERGLRRDMNGSALGLFLCRGCKLHFMLRPALLLPPQRLLTPRSDRTDLSASLGPATRRFGAYRDGTCTRWRSAASGQRPGLGRG